MTEPLSWPRRIALVPLVAAAYFVVASFLVVIGCGLYHYVGWLCCGGSL
jgi:hypothetical protein